MKVIKISGVVVRGDGYGRKLGYPTVNLGGVTEAVTETLPPSGVYSGTASIMSRGILDTYRAGILINPEKEGKRKVEAHLIGYDGDAYGKVITLKLEKFLREYIKFENEQELIAQIVEDLKKC